MIAVKLLINAERY